MHIEWPYAIIGAVFIVLGVASILARNRLASYGLRRQQQGMLGNRRGDSFQTKTAYYVVVGAVFVVAGLLFGWAGI